MSAIQLRDYQIRARDFFLKQNGILADEPGLGKTFPAIASGQLASPDKRKLVIAPAYLLIQWEDAIRDYLGQDAPVLRLKAADPPVDPEFTGWVVTSYHTIESAHINPPKRAAKEGEAPRRPRVAKHPELLTLPWGVVIADEAHRFRGRNSNWTKNSQKLRADHVWELTGTPFVNNPGDVWPLLRLIDPKNHRSYWRFVDTWCVLERTPWATEIHGVKPGLEAQFHEMLDQYMLRRRIEDELPELPPAIPHMVPVELPPALKKAHDAAKKTWMIEHPDWEEGDSIAAGSGGALVIQLRKLTAGVLRFEETDQVVGNPKIDTVKEILTDHPDQSVVIYAYYRDTAQAVANALAKAGWRVYVAHGGVDAETRAWRIENFKRDPAGVLVATMSSMQEGVNIQQARYVVFIEHDYLPSTLTQAIARVRRSGQTHPVNVYHVYAKGTVDESVWRVMHGRHVHVQRALLEDLLLDALPPVRTLARPMTAAA